MTLGYTRSVMVCGMERSKVKVTGSITLHNETSFQTTIALHSHSLGGDSDKTNIGVGSNSMSITLVKTKLGKNNNNNYYYYLPSVVKIPRVKSKAKSKRNAGTARSRPQGLCERKCPEWQLRYYYYYYYYFILLLFCSDISANETLSYWPC